MGRTNEELAVSCKGAELLEGMRFDVDASSSDLKTWAAKY